MYPSVRKDPVVRILKAEKTKVKQDKSFSTTAKPKKIEKQRASIRYRNINRNTEAHISPQFQEEKSEDSTDNIRSWGTSRQESKTKRRRQQKKKVSEKRFKARNENNIINNFTTQKEIIEKQSLQAKRGVKYTSGEDKSIERARTRIYDEQPETYTEHVGDRFILISNKSNTEHLLQNNSRGNPELDVGHVKENNYAFSLVNTKNRERVQYKDKTIKGNYEPHSNNNEIDSTKSDPMEMKQIKQNLKLSLLKYLCMTLRRH